MSTRQVFLLLVIVSASYLFSAVSINAQQKNDDQTISPTEMKEIIELLCGHLEKTYIYPENVEKIRAYLNNNFENGTYKKLTNPGDFAFQLDKELKTITNDQHMGIAYNPKMAADIASDPSGDYYTAEIVDGLKQTNYEFRNLKILEGNIGYLDLREFCPLKYAGETAAAAMNFFANCDALIIDLRYNGGGSDDMVQFLLSYFFDSEVEFSTSYTRKTNSYYQSRTFSIVPGKKLTNTLLYILTSKSTFSAAEAFSYNLKALKRGIIIGEKTRGGENPVEILAIKNKYVVRISSEKLLTSITNANPRWEGIGIRPDIEIDAFKALSTAHIEALKKLSAKTDKENIKQKYQWIIDGVKARLNPYKVDKNILESYEGTFREYKISIIEGELYYQRGDRIRMKMIPFAADSFIIENAENLHVKFIKIDNKIIELNIVFDDGRNVKCPKSDTQK